MQGPSFRIQSDEEEEVLDLHRPSSFQFPSLRTSVGGSGASLGAVPPTGVAGPALGMDMIWNRKKVNPEVMSIGSKSSSATPSEYSEDTDTSERAAPPIPLRSSGGPSGGTPMRAAPYPAPRAMSRASSSSASDGSSEYDEEDEGNAPVDAMTHRFQAERQRMEMELKEKQEILYQMDRLEAKGYKLPRKFSMQSDMEEMRAEYHRILREKEVDASIRFQRKMMMAFVTGCEFLNGRFDPFSMKLDGWSEQVHENILDYDDIFEELHDKYKSAGKKMAPELRLMMSLSGSAFMFHLTNSMFKHTSLPGVEQVLRSDPELMRQFQQRAAQQMNDLQHMSSKMTPPPPQSSQAAGMRLGGGGRMGGGGGGMGGGIFGMVGNLFGGLGSASMTMPPPMNAPMRAAAAEPAIETIIQDVHHEITSLAPSQRMDAMSVSDEEITSIIEDTADLNGILMNSDRGGRSHKRGGSQRKAASGVRTLNL